MKLLPADDRPREKLIEHGPDILSNSELLAILIRTGTPQRSALDIARELTVFTAISPKRAVWLIYQK